MAFEAGGKRILETGLVERDLSSRSVQELGDMIVEQERLLRISRTDADTTQDIREHLELLRKIRDEATSRAHEKPKTPNDFWGGKSGKDKHVRAAKRMASERKDGEVADL